MKVILLEDVKALGKFFFTSDAGYHRVSLRY